MDIGLVEMGGALVATLIGALFYGLRLLSKKVESDYLRGVTERGIEAVQRAVLEVEQTFVKNAKDRDGDGKLGPREARQAKALAVEKAKSYIGKKGLRELAKIAGAGSFVSSAIEASVAKKKL